MKVRNIKIEAKFVVGIEPDYLNHTSLYVNGKPVWGMDAPSWGSGITLHPDSIEEDDQVCLEIPSGQWEGKVLSARYSQDDNEIVIIVRATWEGLANGLTGGLCGLGTFHVYGTYNAVVTESSAIDRPVPYDVYEAVREIAELVNVDTADDSDTRKKAVRMRQILRVLGY